MSAALFFNPEGYTTTGPKLMGRHAAGEGFLRAMLRHAQVAQWWLQVDHPDHAQHFTQAAAAAGRQEPVRAIGKAKLATLAEPGVVYHPGPSIGAAAFERAYFGDAAWSLCGITHTTSSAGAMDAVAALLTAPVQPWDALICTSTAVKTNVEQMLQAQVDYLVQRVGATRVVLPQLPVIPLGIHTDDFAFTPLQRAQARQALGVAEDAVVVLFMGRLSFHAKAHPLAMYQALHAAQARTGRQVVIVECGWHANEAIRKAYQDAAQLACPGIKVLTLDGRVPEQRTTAWAGADVFCSLSDNIQETFGITPIEAMAAGLPVVVSDWDGYRDTVRDGQDGWRIPTWMPHAGLGTDLAARHALGTDRYDMYCGQTCMLVAVDVQKATEAFVRLLESPQERRRMGALGAQRAREVYDWSVIIRQYESLWDELRRIRAQALAADEHLQSPRPVPWPARHDPFAIFAGYPTGVVQAYTRLRLVPESVQAALDQMRSLRSLMMVSFASAVLPTMPEVQQVLQTLAAGPRAALDCVATISPARQAAVFRALTWMIKMNVLAVEESSGSDAS